MAKLCGEKTYIPSVKWYKSNEYIWTIIKYIITNMGSHAWVSYMLTSSLTLGIHQCSHFLPTERTQSCFNVYISDYWWMKLNIFSQLISYVGFLLSITYLYPLNILELFPKLFFLICRSSFYVIDINPQFILDVAYLFSHSATCMLTLWYSSLNRNFQFCCSQHIFQLMILER